MHLHALGEHLWHHTPCSNFSPGVSGCLPQQVKQLYQRISTENESLKGLWATKLNLDGQSGLATEEDLAAYDAKLKELQTELERRKDLGTQFEAVLHRTMQLRNTNEQEREEHQVGFWCFPWLGD